MDGATTHSYSGSVTALICDDDPTSLLILEALIDSLGIEAVTATDVSSAKQLLTEMVPHFAILDIMLPDGDGVDILLEIRRAKLPTAVALITASLQEFPYHKCGNNLPDTLFSKPLDPQAITAWIEEQKTHIAERMIPWERKLVRERLA